MCQSNELANEHSIIWQDIYCNQNQIHYFLNLKSFLFVFNYLTLKVLVHKIQNFIIILHLSISTNTLVQIKKNMIKLLQRLLALNTYILQRNFHESPLKAFYSASCSEDGISTSFN